ncbi:non-ribosomal peptide synthetase, partial [Frankia sp. B2]
MTRSALAEVWPLSPLQEGLLFHALYDEDAAGSYVVQRILDLRGPLDADVLRASVEALLDRHANLRAGFRQAAGMEQPVQVIPRRVKLPWTQVDLSALAEESALAEVSRLTAEDRACGFDPAVPPLLRCTLVRLGRHRHQLVITNHHLLMDGWSLPVMRRELSAIYAAGGDASGLKPVSPYRDYLEWLGRQDRQAARAAWQRELRGADEPTLVATPDRGTVTATATGLARVRVTVPDELTAALRALARSRGLTLNTLVQGAWALLVSRLAGRRDVVFGAVVAGRPPELPGVEEMLGLFVNTVPVRVPLDPAQPVVEMLAELQGRQSELMAYHHLGLAEIQRLAGPGATFDTLLAYENYPRDPGGASVTKGDGLRITPAGSEEAVHYPVSLAVIPGEQLRLRLDCRPEVFDQQTAAELADRFLRVLDGIAADPIAPVGRIGVLGDADQARVVDGWNETGVVVPEVTLSELFEAQVRRSPGAVALVCEGRV